MACVSIRRVWQGLVVSGLLLAAAGAAQAAEPASSAPPAPVAGDEAKAAPAAPPLPPLRDPLKPANVAFYHINDKLYFWVLKPVAQGYNYVMPETARVGVRNFFTNVGMPGRAANCLLQLRFKGVGTELARFGLNTTAGALGFRDVAAQKWHIKPEARDFGQTLGHYGMPPVMYFHLPLLGPSCPRDTIGFLADSFTDPWAYIFPTYPPRIGVKGYDRVNRTSLSIGEYEDLKDAAVDPYVAVRDAYHQYREQRMRK